MAERCILHKNKLNQFREWLFLRGYAIESPKGEYEVLRAKKGLNTVIIYERLNAKEHLTVPQKDYNLVRQFLKETKGDNNMSEKLSFDSKGEPIDIDEIFPNSIDEEVKELDTSLKKYDQEIKADDGKPQCRLVPSEIVRAIARIREYGLKKYGDKESWKSVSIERYQDAMYRHLLAYIDDPKGVDEESGLPHLWHLACNVAFLCDLHKGDFEMNKGGVIK